MVYTKDELTRIVGPIARRYRLRAVYLFGSYARGEATESSDIDLLLDTTGSTIRTLLQLSQVYCELEDALNKPVDVVTVSALEQSPQMPSDIHFREAVRRERVELYAVA